MKNPKDLHRLEWELQYYSSIYPRANFNGRIQLSHHIWKLKDAIADLRASADSGATISQVTVPQLSQ